VVVPVAEEDGMFTKSGDVVELIDVGGPTVLSKKVTDILLASSFRPCGGCVLGRKANQVAENRGQPVRVVFDIGDEIVFNEGQ
jgi:hypothetical protein